MKWSHFLLVPLTWTALTLPASAGILPFGKHAKPDPAQRVPELLMIVRTSQDEHKRVNAVQELRQYEPAQFPGIVPVMIDVLLHDPKPGVRSEAADALSKFRPVSQEVGMALEQALAQDSSMRVRLQARYALMHYHWGGYHGGKKVETVGPIQSGEPPLAGPSVPVPPVVSTAPPAPRLSPVPSSIRRTAPPPAAPVPVSTNARPLPKGMVTAPLVPTEAPRLQTPPPPIADQGPELAPPE